MKNNNTPKFYGLDHLRTLAIVLVLFFHYYILSGGKPKWLPDTFSFGWTGVDLFFVLSGFLIASQLFAEIRTKKDISLKDFFIKRFFRIIPAYAFTLLLYFSIPFFREKESLPPLWKFITFTQNFDLNLKDFGTFSHAWSLCVEEHFYLFLPLLLIFLQLNGWIKKSYFLLIVLFLFGFLIRFYSYNHFFIPKIEDENNWLYWYKYIYYPTYNRLDGLLVGVSIAAIYQFLPVFWEKITKYGNAFLVISVVILSLAYSICLDPMTFLATIFGFPLIAIGYGCMLIGAVSPNTFLYKWKSKITTFIATLSYGIYLTHKGIIHCTHQLLVSYNVDDNLLLLISTVACIVFAYLLYISIEKPFIKIRNKIINSKKI
ncbi:Acyltransferase [Flavobacterium sp. 9AF]|uniref:acyltransferase family protein n=1 Tax=Flavobacterium sp. 9AF TaxID=2653142 RepID=UPI0012EFAC90|nr:acyltransferase [Flavobacterium sp. 9AF]VXB67166.1 Acyltransferase [Flavobacterium sp. 9AF]